MNSMQLCQMNLYLNGNVLTIYVWNLESETRKVCKCPVTNHELDLKGHKATIIM